MMAKMLESCSMARLARARLSSLSWHEDNDGNAQLDGGRFHGTGTFGNLALAAVADVRGSMSCR